MSLKELQLPSIASLRAIAALKSPHLALVRPARLGLGFESAGANQKTLAEVEDALGGPGRLSLSYSLRWLLDMMTGLGVLHRTLSFVHGEVQPEHVVLGDDGVGRLVPVVRAHWVRGEERAPERLYYLAPEKLLGDRVDVRSDVFSVGVMLWEALAGQRLHAAYDIDDIITRLMAGGIPRARAPEGEAWTEPLAVIAERAIAVDPGRRFATIAELKDALQGACARYLASPPGMAQLFQSPRERARSPDRDSVPPESQRATLTPPEPPAPGPTKPPPALLEHEIALESAAARLSRAPFLQTDADEATTLQNRSAPIPVISKAKHISTLLGVPPPFIDRESSPDAITQPFARTPPSAQVIITPLPAPPGSAATPFFAHRLTPSGPPARLTSPSSPPPAASAPIESRSPASFSTLAAAQPRAMPPTVAEPSFELVRPRKRRGALWLLLGAAAAICAFAARPWLAQQVATATGALPDNAPVNADAAVNGPVAPNATATNSVSNAPSNPFGPPETTAVVIASTPAAPSVLPRPRGHRSAREESVVIRDSLNAAVNEAAAGTPVEQKPRRLATPKAPTRLPTAPAPTVKPKAAPVSDADRYGI